MFSSFSNKIIIYALTVSCGVLYTSSFSPIDFKFGMFLSLIIFHIILLKGHRKDNILLAYIFGILFGITYFVISSIIINIGLILNIPALISVLISMVIFIIFGFFLTSKTFHKLSLLGLLYIYLGNVFRNIFNLNCLPQ